ncbi:endonuclease/exonuclease/phosphatase family protein [Halorarius litoreus]|uniref:endonuclease/exonuclease/phosphatase family protein n=1 Tax=Halorarius litoreus TaxID=2962676 RepID=UPI0020CF8D78|nr:endonuclease/exonuclease/phosphatase family protein [Halorarius litoreus]
MSLSRRAALRAVAALPAASIPRVPSWAAAEETRVMTRNLGLGAGLFQLLSADEIDPDLVYRKYREVVDSGVPTRMRAIAEEIDRERPAVVAIQEAATVSRGATGREATQPVAAFLSQLQAGLRTLGAPYRVAVTVENAGVTLPATPPEGESFTVGLVDHDALLVREDVPVAATAAANYGVNARATVGDRTLTATRGYCLAEVELGGVETTAVSTHLASSSGTIRRVQTAELLSALDSRADPVLLLGDFNSGPGAGESSAYASLAREFTDAWVVAEADGPTCCQLPTLHNVNSRLRRRIDAVFVRGSVEPLAVRRTGETPAARVDVGDRTLWASDHAGVIADLRVAPSLDDPSAVVRALL